MQPTAILQIKVEDDRLLSSSPDGKSWAPLLAETEKRFFVQGQDDIRFTFLRDDYGTVTALQLEWHGLQMPLAKKVT